VALAIGEVLRLRQPEQQIKILQTSVIFLERRRILQSSTEFEIMLDNQATATSVAGELPTNLFRIEVIKEFNNNNPDGSTLDEFSVQLVSGPHCYTCAGASDNTLIIIIAVAAGGVITLLCYYIFHRFRKEVRRRKIQKQVKEMFSVAPGTNNRCESDLQWIAPPTEKEIEHLFEEDYMDMEGQIEGFTTPGSMEDTGRGLTEGGTRMIREGDNTLRILSLDELIGRTAHGLSSVSESETDSSNDSPDEPNSPSESPPAKSPPDYVSFMHMPVDQIFERVKGRPHLIKANHKSIKTSERNGKW